MPLRIVDFGFAASLVGCFMVAVRQFPFPVSVGVIVVSVLLSGFDAIWQDNQSPDHLALSGLQHRFLYSLIGFSLGIALGLLFSGAYFVLTAQSKQMLPVTLQLFGGVMGFLAFLFPKYFKAIRKAIYWLAILTMSR